MTGEKTGRRFWRSLDEWANTPEFREMAAREFPAGFFDMLSGPSRRQFLKIMGASVALASITGCRRWPRRELAPYDERPEGFTPGEAEQYATAMEIGGFATGVLVTSYDGRPIKIEGNPLHPASRGAASSIAQASVLELYDPDRSRMPAEREDGRLRIRTWKQFEQAAQELFATARENGGEGVAVLSEATSSPTIAMLRGAMAEKLPQAKWHEWEPLNRASELEGAAAAFGQPVRTHYHLDKADVIACFDADLFMRHPMSLAHAADWAKGRRSADEGRMNRLYVIEPTLTVTGTCADERHAVRRGEIEGRLEQLLDELQAATSNGPRSALAKDLIAHPGKGVVAVGPEQTPRAHALAHAINEKIGAVSETITYTPEPPAAAGSIVDLAAAMKAGEVETLIILGGNPAYDGPADLGFAAALENTPNTLHLSLYANETSRLCRWQAPRAHWLEAWSDARSFDGAIGVQQPLLLPLYDGWSPIELLARLIDFRIQRGEEKVPAKRGYDIVRETYRRRFGGDFESRWTRLLHDGVLAGSAQKPVTPKRSDADLPRKQSTSGYEVVFTSDYAAHDGRFAANGWLQEWPDPISKITWDNAAIMSPRTAENLGVETGDVIRIAVGDRSIEIAAYVLPGLAANVIELPLGYGRRHAGHVGTGVGFDVYPLRTTKAMGGMAGGITVENTGRTYPIVSTQDHHALETETLEERYQARLGEVLREGTFTEYQHHPKFAKHLGPHVPKREGEDVPLQLFEPPVDFEEAADHQWGMVIDLNTCIGCGACVTACQAENNIPIVGKEEVANGREMHWIRVDRYFKGHPDAPVHVSHQPLACVHCENAPCEQVCPVAATVHDSEGLNTMVYNRCVGTRYCSNNCPYKVRRFNYFDYHSRDPRLAGPTPPYLNMPDQQQGEQVDEIKQMVYNPEVTVRMRGVMEKCTYCVQRLSAAKHVARLEHAEGERPDELVRDGEVTPACAQTCPTSAIIFGNLKDRSSEVRKLQEKNPRAYGMLAQLNVRPRTRYLAKLRNPPEPPHESGGHPQTENQDHHG